MSLEQAKEQANSRVSRTVVVLHWLLAASVFFLFVSSWWMLGLPLPSDEFTYRVLPFQLHKNIGFSLFIVIVAMFAIRLFGRDKQELAARSQLQQLADIDHLIVYFLLALCCLSGYLSSSFSGWETTIWWVINLPAWTGEDDALNILFSNIHMWSCWALLAVIAMHIAAAIYHGFGNDGMIDKMFR